MRLPGVPRLFYDIPASPRRTEVLLLLSDVVMVTTPILLVTAALHRAEPLRDALQLGCWAMIPRSMARFFGRINRPLDTLGTFAASVLFVLTTVGLVLAGWEIIYTSAPASHPLGMGTALVTMASWATGFLLFQAHTYRLFDFLCGSVVLLGLFEQKPEPWLWIPIYLLAMLFSAATRHVLHDVHQHARTPHVNLQNLRVLALGGGFLATGIFLTLTLVLNGSLDFPPTPETGASAGVRRRSWTRLVAFPEKRAPSTDDSRRNPGQFLQQPGLSLTEEGSSTRSYAYRGNLTGLARRPASRRVTTIVRGRGIIRDSAGAAARLVLDLPPEELHPTLRWPVPPDLRGRHLYRAITFSIFEPETHTWNELEKLTTTDWPRQGDVAVESDRRLSGGDALFLEFETPFPQFRSFTSLYWTQRYRTTMPRAYRLNAAGVVLPMPRVKRHDIYYAVVQPLPANDFPPDIEPDARPGATHTLELPSTQQLGFDLMKLSRSVFGGSRDRISRLRSYFQNNGFKYSRHVFWKDRSHVLREFMMDRKTGNCAYYATAAALLLRTAGVSTRLAAGYLGGDWNEQKDELYLRASMTHAWVEVFFPGHGWYPLDATAWVPLDSSARSSAEDDLAATNGTLTEESGGGAAGDNSRDRRLSTSLVDGTPMSGRRRAASELARAPDTVEAPGLAGQEQTEEWIQFGPKAAGKRDNPLDVEEILSPGATGPRALARRSGSSPPGEAADEEESALSDTLRQLKFPLRYFLMALGVVAVVLLLASFRRSEEDGPEGAVVDDEDGDNAGSTLARRSRRELDLDLEDPTEIIIAGYHELQRALLLTRNHRRPSQTPLEHVRVLGVRQLALVEAKRTLVELFYRALYGEKEMTLADTRAFEDSCRLVRKHCA